MSVVRSRLLSERDCCPNPVPIASRFPRQRLAMFRKSGLLSEKDCCPNRLLSENSHVSPLLLVVCMVQWLAFMYIMTKEDSASCRARRRKVTRSGKGCALSTSCNAGSVKVPSDEFPKEIICGSERSSRSPRASLLRYCGKGCGLQE